MTEAVFGAVVVIGSAVLMGVAMLWTTYAAMSSRLGPNVLAGIRITATMRDRNAWVAGHRAAWPVVKWTGIGCLVMAGAAAVLAVLGHYLAATVLAFLPVIGVLVSIFPTLRRARTAAEAAPPGD